MAIVTAWGEIIALIGGMCLPLAFSPYGVSIVAVASILLLFLSWNGVKPNRAFLRGYLFGLGHFGMGVSWVYISMNQFGGADALISFLFTLLFVCVLALYPALAGYCSIRFFPTGSIARCLLVFPAVWIFIEWFRAWGILGFPWIQIGYSQLNSPLTGYAAVFGTYGVGWMVALTAGLILVFLKFSTGKKWLTICAVLVLWVGGALLKTIEWTQAACKPFKAILLQGNIPQDIKWLPKNKKDTLNLYAQMTRMHWDSQVIVWPETAVPAFYHEVKDSFLSTLASEAAEHHTDLLFGIPVKDELSGQYYNAIASLGETSGIYRKRHLVPFGEYLPLQPVSGFIAELVEIPMSDFSAGEVDQLLLTAAGYPLAASICYEDAFGHESLIGLPEAAYLVNVTNDAWFGDSSAPHQHLEMARMRALETGRYMLRATNTGMTAIISPSGDIVRAAPAFKRTSISAKIVPMSGSTPYIVYGDWLIMTVLLALLGFAGWLQVKQ